MKSARRNRRQRTSGRCSAFRWESPAITAHYEPYPIFVKDGKGSKIHDIDGNEYIDHNLCFGALMAGHCHPAVVKAVEKRAERWHHFRHAA